MNECDESKYCQATGKRIYTSERQARVATKNISHRLRVYPCVHCRFYHVSKAVTTNMKARGWLRAQRERLNSQDEAGD